MNEVSCRCLAIFFRHARLRETSAERLAVGTGYPLAHLMRPTERIDWSAFARFVGNASQLWSIRELEVVGRDFRRAPISPLAGLRRLFHSPRELYRDFHRPGGAGSMLVTCLRAAFVELDEEQVVIDFELDQGYEYCSEAFHVVRGVLASVPRPLGLPFADVTLTLTPRGARYVIRPPPGGGALAGVRRAFAWPFNAGAAARELKSVNDTLLLRQREIEVARAVLAQQETKLDAAHAVSAIVLRGLDVDQTLVEIAHALVEIGGFASVEVTCQLEIGARISERSVWHGLSPSAPDEPAPAPIELAMTSRNGLETRLRLAPARAADAREWAAMEELALFLEPALLMALDNSRAVSALERQQQVLNQRLYELSRAREVAEKSLRLKSEFVANMSHEIRTPLYGVTGMVRLLEETRLDTEQQQYVELLKKSGQALLAVVNDVLDFSKIEAGKMKLDVVDFDPVALVEDVVDLFANEAEQKGIDLVCETITNDDHMLRGDPLRIRQIVTNLVSNALKFTSKGSVQLRVQIDPGEEMFRLRFDVTDTGIGIDQVFARNLFEPFVQADGSTTRRFGGTGLGLTITKQLCEIMGAQITVQSELGKGATFAVELFLPPSPLRRRAVNDALALERRSGWATKEMLGGASSARREEGAYRAYVTDEQRSDATRVPAFPPESNPFGALTKAALARPQRGSPEAGRSDLPVLSARAPDTSALLAGRRIIVASDRPDSRGAIARTLSPLHAEVSIAGTLDELMRLLRKSEPAALPLLVVDERLCGLGLVAQVKAVGPIPVVLLRLPAGAPATPDRARADAIIAWPVKTSVVAARVIEALQQCDAPPAQRNLRKRTATSRAGVELDVLLLTSDPVGQHIALHLLERHGARVAAASSWRECIELMRTLAFHAIIAEPDIPAGDADDARAALEQARREHATLLVAFGSDGEAATTAGSLARAGDAPLVWDLTLERPIDETELAEVASQVRGHLRTQDERRARVANLGPHA